MRAQPIPIRETTFVPATQLHGTDAATSVSGPGSAVAAALGTGSPLASSLVLPFAGGALLLLYGLMIDPDTGAGGIPCLWNSLLGMDCPGCGLSRAGALLLRGRVQEAAQMNWLIFPFAAGVLWKFARQVLSISEFETSRRKLPWLS